MNFKCSMRFSSVQSYKDKETGEEKYIVKLLDNNDEMYMFFIGDKEKVTPYFSYKHYQDVPVNVYINKNRLNDDNGIHYNVYLTL